MKCPKGTHAQMACRPRLGKIPRKCSRRTSLLVGSKEEACYYAKPVGYNFPPHRPGVTAATRATCAGLENFGRKR